MERFYLIANQTKDRNLTVTRQVAEYLKSHGKQCFLPGESKERGEGFHYTDPFQSYLHHTPSHSSS